MANNELANARKAISTVASGKQVTEDSWMTMWCNSNWGRLLQPAPLSIALLGSIMIIASSTDDFSLQVDGNPLPWKFVRNPDSFKTSLQQMVGEGYRAFETASNSMTRIQNASSQLPGVIKAAVITIVQGSPAEIDAMLPTQLESVTQLAEICRDAADACEKAFSGSSDLAQEMLEACTYKVGKSEQAIKINETRLEVLKVTKEQEEVVVRQSQETSDLMKKTYKQAADDFHDAVKAVPSGWDIVGMQVVESLTNVVTGAANAALSMVSMKSMMQQGGMGNQQNPMAQQMTNPNATSTLPSGPAASDPAVNQVQQVLTLINALELLVSGAEGGKPDWKKIKGEGGGTTSGALYVDISLKTIKERLDQSKPISSQLLPLVAKGLTVTTKVNAVASSPNQDDNAFDADKPTITEVKTGLQSLVTQVNLLLQQPGISPAGPGTPPTAASSSTSAAKLAVETAKFTVDQTRANLQSARDSYDKASSRLIEGQKEITKTIAEMTSVKLESMTLKEMLPVLKKAVKAFTDLRAQFSQLTEFFHKVASLLKDVLGPQITLWTSTMEKSMGLVLGGKSLSDWLRQLIYSQMMVPMKVSMLAEKISETYLHVSDKYIMPAQRNVGNMLQFNQDDDAKFKRQLAEAQTELQRSSQTASEQIYKLVEQDQKKFRASIDQRLDIIKNALVNVVPGLDSPPPKAITSVTDKHLKEYDTKDAAIAKADPTQMFNLDDLV